MCFNFSLGTSAPKPSNIIPMNNLVHEDGMLKIKLYHLRIPFTKPPKLHPWALMDVPGTGSMRPTFGSGHNLIYIEPADVENHAILCDWLETNTKAGYRDIIAYRIPNVFGAVHRIQMVGHDADGRFFKCKGDNFFVCDPYKIRDEHIEVLCAGIVF